MESVLTNLISGGRRQGGHRGISAPARRSFSGGRGPALLLAALLAVGGVAAAAGASLYQRLGGEPVVQAVTEDLIDHAAADPRTARSFDGVNMKRLKKHVALYLCWITGGGCAWHGDSMKQAHAGLQISDAEMNRFVEQLIEALDRQGVGQREKNELLALLAPEKRDVVTRP